METSLQGKIAFITGSSRGVGRAIAMELAERRADVVVHFLKKRAAAMAVAEGVEKLGQRAIVTNGNLGEPEEIRRIFAEIRDAFGSLDIFVNNAALGIFRPILEIKERHWQQTMDINVTAFLLCAQEAVKLMEGHGGKIVSISSLGSRRYIGGYAAMGAAKAAIESLTRYLAVELADKGIGVNAVCGGLVETDALASLPDSEGLKAEGIKATPGGRLGRPEDLAKVVAFLCSADADWICGQTIVVDGGLSLV
jgi:enoyl-[acyl-carrier protein] reductase III